jgi:hypothetical protein
MDSRDLPHVHRGKEEHTLHRTRIESSEHQEWGELVELSICPENTDAREVHWITGMGTLDAKTADSVDPGGEAGLDGIAGCAEGNRR